MVGAIPEERLSGMVQGDHEGLDRVDLQKIKISTGLVLR